MPHWSRICSLSKYALRWASRPSPFMALTCSPGGSPAEQAEKMGCRWDDPVMVFTSGSSESSGFTSESVDFSHWLARSCWAVITDLCHMLSPWIQALEGTFLMDTSGNGINWKGLACCKALQQHVSALKIEMDWRCVPWPEGDVKSYLHWNHSDLVDE